MMVNVIIWPQGQVKKVKKRQILKFKLLDKHVSDSLSQDSNDVFGFGLRHL